MQPSSRPHRANMCPAYNEFVKNTLQLLCTPSEQAFNDCEYVTKRMVEHIKAYRKICGYLNKWGKLTPTMKHSGNNCEDGAEITTGSDDQVARPSETKAVTFDRSQPSTVGNSGKETDYSTRSGLNQQPINHEGKNIPEGLQEYPVEASANSGTLSEKNPDGAAHHFIAGEVRANDEAGHHSNHSKVQTANIIKQEAASDCSDTTAKVVEEIIEQDSSDEKRGTPGLQPEQQQINKGALVSGQFVFKPEPGSTRNVDPVHQADFHEAEEHEKDLESIDSDEYEVDDKIQLLYQENSDMSVEAVHTGSKQNIWEGNTPASRKDQTSFSASRPARESSDMESTSEITGDGTRVKNTRNKSISPIIWLDKDGHSAVSRLDTLPKVVKSYHPSYPEGHVKGLQRRNSSSSEQLRRKRVKSLEPQTPAGAEKRYKEVPQDSRTRHGSSASSERSHILETSRQTPERKEALNPCTHDDRRRKEPLGTKDHKLPARDRLGRERYRRAEIRKPRHTQFDGRPLTEELQRPNERLCTERFLPHANYSYHEQTQRTSTGLRVRFCHRKLSR